MSHDFPQYEPEAAVPDPLRHRREIEQMEQRFRQRSDRPVAEPSTTGAMDERVQEEMRQFFSESTQILEEVVPSLKRDDEHLSDTTGEIRRKIDAFFGDAGGTGMIRSERTMPIGAIDLRAGLGAAAAPVPPPPAARSLPPLRQAAARPAGLESTPQLRRANASEAAAQSPAPYAARPVAPPRSAIPALAPAAPPPPPAAARRSAIGAPGAAKMDLKTALERLRRHGIVRDEAPSLAAAAPAAPPPSYGTPSPSAYAPPHPAPPPPPPPAATRAPRPLREPEPIAPRRLAAHEPVQVDVPAYEPSRLRTPAAEPSDPFAPPAVPPAPLLARPESRSATFEVPAPAPAPLPLPPRLDARPTPFERPPAPLRADEPAFAGRGLEIPRVEPIAATQESGEGFDEIFAEVEGLVRGTLADSIEETLEEARVAEDNMRSGNRGRPRAAPRPRPVEAAQPRFVAPRDDEDDECDEEDEAPAGPYNWGVSSANRPAGAWLLEEGAEQAARTKVHEKARKTGEITGIDVGAWRESVDEAEDAPELAGRRMAQPDPTEPVAPPPPRLQATEPSTGAMMGAGATSLLARKLETESSRMGPIMDALAAKGLVDSDDDEDDEFDDDDEVSVASFKDDRPRGEDNGVTPMRIVEEIRRLRRIQEILMSKGLVSEDEIQAAAPSDG